MTGQVDEAGREGWCVGCGSPIGPDDEEGPRVAFPEGVFHFGCWENHVWKPEEEAREPAMRDELMAAWAIRDALIAERDRLAGQVAAIRALADWLERGDIYDDHVRCIAAIRDALVASSPTTPEAKK